MPINQSIASSCHSHITQSSQPWQSCGLIQGFLWVQTALICVTFSGFKPQARMESLSVEDAVAERTLMDIVPKSAPSFEISEVAITVKGCFQLLVRLVHLLSNLFTFLL